jgi:hypothetical protein
MKTYLDSSEYIDWKHPLVATKAAEQVFENLPDIEVIQVNHAFNTDAPKPRPYLFKR